MEDVAMNTVFDLAPLWRSSVGFERLFDLVNQAAKWEPTDNYPPYDIAKTGDNTYRIALAVAGFTADELSITSHPNLLVVTGKKAERQDGSSYLYQGIAGRSFERRFNLAEHVKVTGARLENGLLIIELVHELPEEMKPRRIPILSGTEPQAIEEKQAA
jgi:molecular chaperone IbpA